VTELTGLLHELEEQWRRHHLPIVDKLKPGLEATEVRQRLQSVGLAAPSEIIEWYGWHDGAEPQGRMAPLFDTLTLAKCLELYVLNVRAKMQDPLETPGLLPVMVSGRGECVVVDARDENSEVVVVALQGRELDLAPPEYHLPSLATLIGWWVELFKSDAWSAHPDFEHDIKSNLSTADRARYPQIAVEQGFVI